MNKLSGLQQSMTHQVEAELRSSPCFKAGRGNTAWGTGPQKPAKYQGQVLTPPLGAPQRDKLQNCDTHAEGLHRVHGGSPTVGPESMYSHYPR